MAKKLKLNKKDFTTKFEGDNLTLFYNPNTGQMIIVNNKTKLGDLINEGQQYIFPGEDKLRREFNLLAYRLNKSLGRVK